MAAEARRVNSQAQGATAETIRSNVEAIQGFIRILEQHAFRPLPIYLLTSWRPGLIVSLKNFFEPSGSGWYLTIRGDGANSLLVIATDGRTNRGSLSTPDNPYKAVSGSVNRGLPGRGSFLVSTQLAPAQAPEIQYDDAEAMKRAAALILNGATQRSVGSAGAV